MKQEISVEKLYDVIEERINNTQPLITIGGKKVKAGSALRALDESTWNSLVSIDLHVMQELGIINEVDEVFTININEDVILEMFKKYDAKE